MALPKYDPRRNFHNSPIDFDAIDDTIPYEEGRRKGMREGLEMAARFVALSKSKKDIEPMIRAAIATIDN